MKGKITMKKYLTVFLVALVTMTLLMLPGAMAEAVDAVPSVNLTPLIDAAIKLLASIVLVMIIPWVKSKLTAQQQELVRAAVSVAVYAAEQLYGAGAGKEKLMYVKGQLAKKGFHVDIDEIEAAVHELAVISE